MQMMQSRAHRSTFSQSLVKGCGYYKVDNSARYYKVMRISSAEILS